MTIVPCRQALFAVVKRMKNLEQSRIKMFNLLGLSMRGDAKPQQSGDLRKQENQDQQSAGEALNPS